MRCFFICTLSLVVCLQASAQKSKKAGEDEDKVFTKIDVNAQTDQRAWAAYIKKAAVLMDSEMLVIPPGSYQVTVKFIVDQNGNIADVKATTNPGYGLARKAEKIISGYEGVWHPANQCGRNVKSYKEQVVVFVVK